MTQIFSACMTVERRCAMTIVVRPLHMVSSANWIWCSVCVSRADVASSRSTILGLLRMVRAIATRCFSPPDRRSPRSPTSVSYLSGKLMMASWIDAACAAAMISLSVASGRPYSRLYLMVSLKSTVSWGTTPMAFLSDDCWTSRMSTPSILMLPPPTRSRS
mmetsp:Transcript_33941/g.83415  ORF Transcript_33941/g.83415 Transcript_33941/m.83415 type:complete len:161 (-) Transcript_33941:879-1361(-)